MEIAKLLPFVVGSFGSKGSPLSIYMCLLHLIAGIWLATDTFVAIFYYTFFQNLEGAPHLDFNGTKQFCFDWQPISLFRSLFRIVFVGTHQTGLTCRHCSEGARSFAESCPKGTV